MALGVGEDTTCVHVCFRFRAQAALDNDPAFFFIGVKHMARLLETPFCTGRLPPELAGRDGYEWVYESGGTLLDLVVAMVCEANPTVDWEHKTLTQLLGFLSTVAKARVRARDAVGLTAACPALDAPVLGV